MEWIIIEKEIIEKEMKDIMNDIGIRIIIIMEIIKNLEEIIIEIEMILEIWDIKMILEIEKDSEIMGEI